MSPQVGATVPVLNWALRVWPPCRHLAQGEARHHTSLNSVIGRVTAYGEEPELPLEKASSLCT